MELFIWIVCALTLVRFVYFKIARSRGWHKLKDPTPWTHMAEDEDVKPEVRTDLAANLSRIIDAMTYFFPQVILAGIIYIIMLKY